MMKYTILTSDRTERLEEKVMAHIKAGWVPQGGVATNWSDDYEAAEYAQAMVKNEININLGINNEHP